MRRQTDCVGFHSDNLDTQCDHETSEGYCPFFCIQCDMHEAEQWDNSPFTEETKTTRNNEMKDALGNELKVGDSVHLIVHTGRRQYSLPTYTVTRLTPKMVEIDWVQWGENTIVGPKEVFKR